MMSGATLFKITQETTREKERGKKMNKIDKTQLDETNLQNHIRLVSILTGELNVQLEDWDVYSAEKTLKDIQIAVESIKSQIKYFQQ
jgi:hypothetical protein